MKKLTILIAMLMASSAWAWSWPWIYEVPQDQLEWRDGLIKYEVNSQTPFTGRALSYYDNGQLKAYGNYKDGKIYGVWKTYWDTGEVQILGRAKDGKEVLREFYDKSGKLSLREKFIDGEKIE